MRTAWGFLAVRLPMPGDEQWAADQVTILQALGVLDPEGNPTGRLEVVKAADVARLTQEDWDAERNEMISISIPSGVWACSTLSRDSIDSPILTTLPPATVESPSPMAGSPSKKSSAWGGSR